MNIEKIVVELKRRCRELGWRGSDGGVTCWADGGFFFLDVKYNPNGVSGVVAKKIVKEIIGKGFKYECLSPSLTEEPCIVAHRKLGEAQGE